MVDKSVGSGCRGGPYRRLSILRVSLVGSDTRGITMARDQCAKLEQGQ